MTRTDAWRFRSPGSAALCALLGLLLMMTMMMTGCHWDDDCCNDCDRYVYELEFDHVVTIDTQTDFRLRGISGSIEIDGTGTTDEVHIRGERVVKAKNRSAAEDYMDDLEVRITTGETEVAVTTIHPSNSSCVSFEVDYHVQLPRTWSVDLENVNGNITLDDLQNGVTLTLTNGNVNAANVTGNTSMALINGEISAGIELIAGGSCVLSNTNGRIDLTIPTETSAAFSAHIVNGVISTSGLSFSDLQSTNTTTTGILGSGNGQITLNCINGSIKVRGI